jgi:hypothetical protein
VLGSGTDGGVGVQLTQIGVGVIDGVGVGVMLGVGVGVGVGVIPGVGVMLGVGVGVDSSHSVHFFLWMKKKGIAASGSNAKNGKPPPGIRISPQSQMVPEISPCSIV